MALGLPPLSLYVHLPWCVRKCPYCDFNSHTAPARIPERAYVDALLNDLERDLEWVQGRALLSVFIGGGTPSLFSPAAIARLLEGIAARVPLAPGAEITLEANPGTLEHAPVAEYASAGVSRLSLGVQSFDDALLERIGRIHSATEARDATAAARAAGFAGLNLDLMYGLPGQTPAQALADLGAAIELGPTHVSHYQLTLEPNTYFHVHPPPLPDEDEVFAMQIACQELLAEAGYAQYEVSAYARPGQRCVHNLNYWRFGDYLGIGAGAHAKLTDPAGQRIVRLTRERHPRTYLEFPSAPLVREVAGAERMFEYALNALRLTDGFPIAQYRQRTGLSFSEHDPPWADALARGWVQRDGDMLRPTPIGFRFLNEVLALFLPAEEAALA